MSIMPNTLEKAKINHKDERMVKKERNLLNVRGRSWPLNAIMHSWEPDGKDAEASDRTVDQFGGIVRAQS